MGKLFVLLSGSFCILMIQSATGEGRNFGKEGSPDLLCLGFAATGCRVACNVLTQLYNIPTSSTCNLREKCICRTKVSSVNTLWNQNFQQNQTSKQLLSYIKKKSHHLDETREILREFPRTPQDHLEELKKEFPNMENLQNLQPIEVTYPLDHFASRSRSELRDIIAEAFKKIKLPSKKLEKIDYIEQIEQFIEADFKDNEEFKQAVHKQLCQVDHETTKEILKKHFPDETCDNIDSVDIKPYDRLTHEIAIFVVKELITKFPISNEQ